jgi:hypothetical protein
MTKQATQADAGPQLLLGDERRRSQRVMIRIPVTLEVMVAGKKVTVHAGTASVNDHGAMLLCTKSFPVDTLLDMINDRTAQKPTGLSDPYRILRSCSGFLAHLLPTPWMEAPRQLSFQSRAAPTAHNFECIRLRSPSLRQNGMSLSWEAKITSMLIVHISCNAGQPGRPDRASNSRLAGKANIHKL